ncbi:MAG TPA: metallophosphoesterase, partial [Firmicutes bacterium]|nr:metallophosphoesterase [Bacillota bacterium]
MRVNQELWARLKYWGRLTVLSLAGALVALYLFSAVSFSANSLEFMLELVPFNRGETVIVLPPLGEVRALTHRAPFMIKLTLVNLKPDFLTDTLPGLSGDSQAWQLKKQLGEKLFKCIFRWSVISGLGGAGAWFLCNRKTSGRSLLAGGILASVLGLLLFGCTVALPYDLDAFKKPRYQGAIGAAPWVVDLVADSLSSLKTAGEQLKVLSVHMRNLCEQLEQTYPATEDVSLTVLAISDLHNNPAALKFIDKIIQTFQIDLIVDAGDLTDYGTALEAELVRKIAGLPVPYLFIPGNHDNPQVVAALREVGAQVVEDQILEVAGLRVLGLADPASDSPSMEVAPESKLRA